MMNDPFDVLSLWSFTFTSPLCPDALDDSIWLLSHVWLTYISNYYAYTIMHWLLLCTTRIQDGWLQCGRGVSVALFGWIGWQPGCHFSLMDPSTVPCTQIVIYSWGWLRWPPVGDNAGVWCMVWLAKAATAFQQTKAAATTKGNKLRYGNQKRGACWEGVRGPLQLTSCSAKGRNLWDGLSI